MVLVVEAEDDEGVEEAVRWGGGRGGPARSEAPGGDGAAHGVGGTSRSRNGEEVEDGGERRVAAGRGAVGGEPRSRSGRGERDEGVGVSSIQIGSRGEKVGRRGVRVSGCEGIRE